MARYEHLLVFKVAYDLTVWMENKVGGVSRYRKCTIGHDLRNGARGVQRRIELANSSVDKRPQLERLRGDLDELTVLVRLAKGVKALAGLAGHQHCVNELSNLSRQSAGWLRSLGGQQPESAAPPAGGPGERDRRERGGHRPAVEDDGGARPGAESGGGLREGLRASAVLRAARRYPADSRVGHGGGPWRRGLCTKG
ncbi:MAG: four helix bundle protein [Holophagales bacterium]|nr:four helix bundle protein [Holophagales bacterium]